MPDSIFGLPFYITVAFACLGLVVLIGIIRGDLFQEPRERSLGINGPARAAAPSVSGRIQMVASLLGILSFAMQILQWLKII